MEMWLVVVGIWGRCLGYPTPLSTPIPLLISPWKGEGEGIPLPSPVY